MAHAEERGAANRAAARAADGAAASSAVTDDNEAFESGDRHIGMASFTIGDVLGEGNYSQIMAVTMRATQERYALKVVDKDKVKRNKKTTDVLVEKWVLRHVEHPSIIKLFHTFQDRGALYLVLELVAGGELGRSPTAAASSTAGRRSTPRSSSRCCSTSTASTSSTATSSPRTSCSRPTAAPSSSTSAPPS